MIKIDVPSVYYTSHQVDQKKKISKLKSKVFTFKCFQMLKLVQLILFEIAYSVRISQLKIGQMANFRPIWSHWKSLKNRANVTRMKGFAPTRKLKIGCNWIWHWRREADLKNDLFPSFNLILNLLFIHLFFFEFLMNIFSSKQTSSVYYNHFGNKRTLKPC